MKLNRRDALALLGVAAAAPAGAQARIQASFAHGVASGDPAADSVLLWTRVTPGDPAARIAVRWALWTDATLSQVVAKGETVTDAARDFTVKVVAEGLQAGQDYWYRFEAGGAVSGIGRTRTLPLGPTDKVVMGVVSCSLYQGGLFNAYQALAMSDRLDVVTHLGDYIYEAGAAPQDYGGKTGAPLGRGHLPAHEIESLADYRQRHAQYKTDPDLQAAHARAPWICVWDDHETANDSWSGGAEAHTPAAEGDWNARKGRALQAYYEWMPIRDPLAGQAFEAVNRAFSFGDLASLIMVETRLQGRNKQLSYEDPADLPVAVGPDGAPVPDFAAFLAKRADPGRQLLGRAQEAWLGGALKRSVAMGQAWQVLGNQVVMARVRGPNLTEALSPLQQKMALASLAPDLRPRVERVAKLFTRDLPFNLDSWDGYPAARERLYGLMTAANARPLVLSGDSHAFWVNELHDDAGKLVAAEFGTTSITSPGWGDDVPSFDLGALIALQNPEVLFNDQRAKGFIRLTLTHVDAVAELVEVSTIRSKPFAIKVLKTYRVSAAQPGVSGVEAL
ncbi:alkaline phosphatase D family protein [Phenylobacterium immobile]|uniref:alkaline phosphatase D family protein n=1 Tax=Phenylobacterium immobile TaxID=21 RepID=UPI000B01CE5A|nr:alkaline phosphatase D family protein [Phenylobacterium immobile]